MMSYMFGITANNFKQLPAFIIVCSIFVILPLLLLPLMEKEHDQQGNYNETFIPLSESESLQFCEENIGMPIKAY